MQQCVRGNGEVVCVTSSGLVGQVPLLDERWLWGPSGTIMSQFLTLWISSTLLLIFTTNPFQMKTQYSFVVLGFLNFWWDCLIGPMSSPASRCGCNTTLNGCRGNMSHITTPLYPQPDLCVVFVSAGSCVAGGWVCMARVDIIESCVAWDAGKAADERWSIW